MTVGRPKGYPKTGGRQKGSKNHVLQATDPGVDRAILAIIGRHETGLTPLQMMLVVADIRFQTGDYAGALVAASAAAPYLHARLSSTEVTFHNDDARKSDEQLEQEIAELQAKLGKSGVWMVN